MERTKRLKAQKTAGSVVMVMDVNRGTWHIESKLKDIYFTCLLQLQAWFGWDLVSVEEGDVESPSSAGTM